MEQVILVYNCKDCKKDIKLPVKKEDFNRYMTGKVLVQNAFPYLTADQREIMISGICGKCFDNLFKEKK